MVGGSPRLQRRQFTTNQARTAAPPNQMTTDNAVRLTLKVPGKNGSENVVC